MPEYLAPGVFVEEIDTGLKPIEGVSTSTAGMIGLTERGPVDVPILITSLGEFTRWFGERLSLEEFGDLCYLPYAVEGFFTNGGKRLFVTRVLDTSGAVRATFRLFDRGTAASADTALLRRAGESTGTLANAPALYVLDPTMNVGDFLRIGDGSNAEYHQVAALGTVIQHVPLSFPLNLSHAALTAVDGLARVVDAAFPGGFTLTQAAAGGSTSIIVTGSAADIAALVAATNPLLEIGAANAGEHRIAGSAASLTATTARVDLLGGSLVLPYAIGAAVTPLDRTGAPTQSSTLQPASSAGDSLVYVNTVGALNVRNDLAVVGGLAAPPATMEVRRIGELDTIVLSTGATEDYPAGSLVEEVVVADDTRSLAAAVAAGATSLTLVGTRLDNLQPGTQLLVEPGANEETVTVVSLASPNVNVTAFANGHAINSVVSPDFDRKTLGTATPAGTSVIALANRVGLAADDVLRIGNAPDDEFVAIRSIPARAAAGADPGNVVLEQALRRAHAAGDPVRRQAAPAPGGTQPTVLAAAVPRGSATLVVTDGVGITANDFVRVTVASGESYFHRAQSAATAANPRDVTLTTELTVAHDVGAAVVGRDPLLNVEALDAGAWGDRLRVSVEDEDTGLVSRTTLGTVVDPTHIRLGSASGVEQGTILELTDVNGAVVGAPLKVDFVNRQANFMISLAGAGLDAAQQAAHAAAVGAGQRLGVRSREFRLTILLLHQLDPARPTRNSIVIASEVFRHLSLDPRHSRYVHTVIGDTAGPLRLSDRRPEGESWYVRVHDPNPSPAVRLGPEALVDVLPNGQRRAARHRLGGGHDSLGTVSDATYIGTDNVDPDLRTGLFTMTNIDDVSILAAPGRTSPAMQNALIAQCENLRYRFTVLDGPPPPADTIPDVQSLRQQYDTRYAALYHPWLLIDDPYPRNVQAVGTFPVPPSGSVMGIYARTDIERGVHKAPANEVVRGIVGLQRSLNKAEQEILNPFPQNINVIRDFRPNNRSIRVWGGRVITSDPDWKYVNVRRLLIFIEKSIDIGLQWVVFEPNADPLWARVRRTISMFLTGLWRDGALEGATREEAYFVKCDRTTMTQADIDNGRLIVVVGVAPVKPAEFVIIRIGLWTAHAEP
jgi:phage tail sheath protein FI